MTWGPFTPGLDQIEVKARLRCLRLASKLLCGQRSVDCRHALLRAEIEPDEGTLAAAAAAFDRLSSLDRRRVLSAMIEVVR